MTARVAHPILRLVVVRPDGSRAAGHRVFCRYQRRSVETARCHGCTHCDEITVGPDPAVVCTLPITDEDADVDMVGAVLSGDTVALDPGASIGEALELLHAVDRRLLAVVDPEGTLVGVVHEVAFLRPTKATDVAGAMSSPLALHESTPVRRALRLLASAHLREAAVVDDQGHPVGVFRDVDGLRYLTRARAMLPR